VKIDASTLKTEITKQGGDLNSLGGPELALAVLVTYNSTRYSKETPTASSTQGAVQGFGPGYQMESYKKASFVEKVYSERDNNLDVLGNLLFKLYGGGRFNEAIQTSVAGNLF
jgi:hypothetical protein